MAVDFRHQHPAGRNNAWTVPNLRRASDGLRRCHAQGSIRHFVDKNTPFVPITVRSSVQFPSCLLGLGSEFIHIHPIGGWTIRWRRAGLVQLPIARRDRIRQVKPLPPADPTARARPEVIARAGDDDAINGGRAVLVLGGAVLRRRGRRGRALSRAEHVPARSEDVGLQQRGGRAVVEEPVTHGNPPFPSVSLAAAAAARQFTAA